MTAEIKNYFDKTDCHDKINMQQLRDVDGFLKDG